MKVYRYIPLIVILMMSRPWILILYFFFFPLFSSNHLLDLSKMYTGEEIAIGTS